MGNRILSFLNICSVIYQEICKQKLYQQTRTNHWQMIPKSIQMGPNVIQKSFKIDPGSTPESGMPKSRPNVVKTSPPECWRTFRFGAVFDEKAKKWSRGATRAPKVRKKVSQKRGRISMAKKMWNILKKVTKMMPKGIPNHWCFLRLRKSLFSWNHRYT